MSLGQSLITAEASNCSVVLIESSHQDPLSTEVLFQGFLLLHRAPGLGRFHLAFKPFVFLMQNSASEDFKIRSLFCSCHLPRQCIMAPLIYELPPGVLV